MPKGNRRERKHLTLSQQKKNLRGVVGLRETLKIYGKIKQRIKGAPAEIQNTPSKTLFLASKIASNTLAYQKQRAPLKIKNRSTTSDFNFKSFIQILNYSFLYP